MPPLAVSTGLAAPPILEVAKARQARGTITAQGAVTGPGLLRRANEPGARIAHAEPSPGPEVVADETPARHTPRRAEVILAGARAAHEVPQRRQAHTEAA